MERYDVVIAGGGIAGVASAYFLSLRGLRCAVVEPVAIASAASGKAGGFLANWPSCDATRKLHQHAMALHARIAKDLCLKSYRELATYSCDTNTSASDSGDATEQVAWTPCRTTLMDSHTAQIEPREITTALFAHSGATLIVDEAVGLAHDGTAVLLASGRTVHSSRAIVLAMGPWMPKAQAFFGERYSFPMHNPCSTSLVYRNRPVLAEALFCSEHAPTRTHLELYPRPNGELYVCGVGEGGDLTSKQMLRNSPAEPLQPLPHRVAAAQRAMEVIVRADVLSAGEPPLAQVCLRPCFADALPMVGHLEGSVYVCGGGNCWGILWGPAMGEAIAQLVCDGAATAFDVTPFAPARFTNR